MKQLGIGRHLCRTWSRGLEKSIRNFANVVQRCCTSEESPNWPESRANLGALEALVFILFKYVFSWFPEHFFKTSVFSPMKIFFFATPIEINLIHLNMTAVLQNKGEFDYQFGYKMVIT